MITLTRLDDTRILLNCDLISHVQIGADSVVFMTDGNSFVVKETPEEIEGLVIRFKKRIYGIEPLKS